MGGKHSIEKAMSVREKKLPEKSSGAKKNEAKQNKKN